MGSHSYRGKEGIIYKSYVGEVSLIKKDHKTAKRSIGSSSCANAFFRKIWIDDINIKESMYVLFLNQRHNVNAWACISQGSSMSTTVDISILAKLAMETLSKHIILCHNHPSGNCLPSLTDERLAKKISNGLKLLDIMVLDFMIIADDGYLSFAEEEKI